MASGSNPVALAAAAWDRLCEEAHREAQLRVPGKTAKDDAAERWLAASKSQFLSAWRHASSMTNSEDIRKDYAEFLTQPAQSVVRTAMDALSVDLQGLLTVMRSDEAVRQFKDVIHGVEGVLVACLGHYAARPRGQAVRLLNALYDGIDWQLAQAHDPIVAFVGEAATVDVYTSYQLGGGATGTDTGIPEVFRVLVSAPSFNADGAPAGTPEHLLTIHTPTVTTEEVWLPVASASAGKDGAGSPAAGDGVSGAAAAASSDGVTYVRATVTRVQLSLAPFTRCGFYDWRVAAIAADGTAQPVSAVTPLASEEVAQLTMAGVLPATGGSGSAVGGGSPTGGASSSSSSSASVRLAQGRFIVHKAGLREEHLHEVAVDLVGMAFSDGGDVIRHGTFEAVTKKLGQLKADGVSTLYVLGGLERDNGWGETEAAAAAAEGPAPAADVAGGGGAPAEEAAADAAVAVTPRAAAAAAGGGGLARQASTGLGGRMAVPATPGVPQYAPVPSGRLSISGESEGGGDASGFGEYLDASGAAAASGGDAAGGASGGGGAPGGAAPVTFTHAFGGGASAAAASGEEALTPGTRAYAARPNANPSAVVDRFTPNRMLGGQAGLLQLLQASGSEGMRLMLQCNASVSASRPHRRYKHLYAYTLDTKGQAIVHAGTDSNENQWEDTHLLNYRKVEAWDLLVSEMKTLVQNYTMGEHRIGGLYLSDCQSYPFIQAMDVGELFRRDVDGEGHYSPREILEGEVVISNAEIGYWSTRACRAYPNPLLVKLTRAMWAINPLFTVAGECRWGRAPALVRSGVVPHALDLVSAMASTLGRYVDKTGATVNFTLPRDVGPVAYLKALVAGEEEGALPPQSAPQYATSFLRNGGTGSGGTGGGDPSTAFPNPLRNLLMGPAGRMPHGGQQIVIRSLCSARIPYPAALLGRSAWTGVDCMYTLPGVPMTFLDETSGAALRLDISSAYVHNERYLEEERRKEERRKAAEKAAMKQRATVAGGAAAGTPAGGVGGMPAPSASNPSFSTGSTPASGPAAGHHHLPHHPPAHSPLHSGSSVPPPASASGGHLDQEGDVGVGGVIPAGPLRGAVGPTFKLTRTGFSTADLSAYASAADVPSGSATTTSSGDAGFALLETDETSGDDHHQAGVALAGHRAALPPHLAGGGGGAGKPLHPAIAHLRGGLPAAGKPVAAGKPHHHAPLAHLVPGGGLGGAPAVSAAAGVHAIAAQPPHPPHHPVPATGPGAPSTGGGLLRSRMVPVSSSPALQNLLLMGDGTTPEDGELYSPFASPAGAMAAGATGGGHLFSFHNKAASITSTGSDQLHHHHPGTGAGGGFAIGDDDEEEGEDGTGSETTGSVATPTVGLGAYTTQAGGAPGGGAIALGGFASRAIGAAGAISVASGSGVALAPASSAAIVRRPGTGLAASGVVPAAAPPAGGAGAAAAASAPGGGLRFGAEPTRVTSWQSADAVGLKGDAATTGNTSLPVALLPAHKLREVVKGMPALEARIRSEIGPEYGFDLTMIKAHYTHRRLLRERFPLLRSGDVAVLTARHRYGEHGHVFAFARHTPGQVAVIAANFNGHPSTFAVDCAPLTTAFGASTAADASATVATLTAASVQLGLAVRSLLQPAGTGADSTTTTITTGTSALATSSFPSLNLRGGVWEVRDIFACSPARLGQTTATGTTAAAATATTTLKAAPGATGSSSSSGSSGHLAIRAPAGGDATATAGGYYGAWTPHTPAGTGKTTGSGVPEFDGVDFNHLDGPLVGIVTSEEAAYAPIMAHLGPHRSHCWLYCAAATGAPVDTSAASAALSPRAASSVRAGAATSGGLLRAPSTYSGAPGGDRETDPAAMQWLFASSLLRLQAILRLKECGLTSGVITKGEVAAAGGYEALWTTGRRAVPPAAAAAGTGSAAGGASTSSSSASSAGPSGSDWIAPGEALKDEEIQAAARHNLVYSLLRHVVKRAYRHVLAARAGLSPSSAAAAADASAGAGPLFGAAAAGSSSTGGSDAAHSAAGGAGTASGSADGSAPASSPVHRPLGRDVMRGIIGDTATMLEAALRVLVTHWQLKPAPVEGSGSGSGVSISGDALGMMSGPARLQADPLPSLHGALNRGADAATAASSTASAAPAGRDPEWHCIDADAAATVVRAALFLAVKDVVAQARGVLPSADVSDEDGALSEVVLKALRRVGAGMTTAGTAARTHAASSAWSAVPPTLLRAEAAAVAFARRLLWSNSASPIVFATPELGKWSTVGGLGVMVDELSVGLAELGAEVVCISPYYNVNRKGVSDYLRADGITYTGRTIAVYVGGERIEMGVHEGRVKGVRVFFLHNALVFPKPYPDHSAHAQVRVLAAFGKAFLELLCQWHLIPSLVVTNDWFTGLIPAYARKGHFGDVFNRTDFMHIAHNLNPDYEGRLWPDRSQGTLQHLHELPSDLLVDPHWSDIVVNPTRAALLCSDTWATVSRSYRQDLLNDSPLRSLLRLAPHPFAHPNGIPVKARLQRLQSLPASTHEAAKAALQKKYFGFDTPDTSMPLFAFVGRITLQKGVHLILQAVEEILHYSNFKCMFLVGGMASAGDTYGNNCAGFMRELHARHKDRFWANPDLFFTDGDLVNLGADFCLMPSMFEPGGIVQQEFFVAGTPVVAFKTGGLKDTVKEWVPPSTSADGRVVPSTGNGFTFEAYNRGDFIAACKRAMDVYSRPGDYAQLRANARASVMDLAVVSLAWFREFHRVRRCLPPPIEKVPTEFPVTFAVAVGDIPSLTRESVVEVTGSFASWNRKVKLPWSDAASRFEGTILLAPGVHQYKFVVDGGWTTAPTQPVVDDGTGNINNVLALVPSPMAGDAGDE